MHNKYFVSMHTNIDKKLIPYLQSSSFYGIANIGLIEINHALITALIERWRPDTHTFHLTIREITIILQDVQIITGLPVDSQTVVLESSMCSIIGNNASNREYTRI